MKPIEILQQFSEKENITSYIDDVEIGKIMAKAFQQEHRRCVAAKAESEEGDV